MTHQIRVAIADAFGLDGIAVHVMRRSDTDWHGGGAASRFMLHIDDGHPNWRPVEDGLAPLGNPAFALDDDTGRAITDALVTHYGGGPDLRQARADLVAANARCDKLLAALIEVAGDAVAALGDTAVAALEPPPPPVLAERHL